MKAYEFPAKITTEGHLELPEDLAASLSGNQSVRVIILVDEPTEDQETEVWSRLAAQQLLSQYSEADAVYDQL